MRPLRTLCSVVVLASTTAAALPAHAQDAGVTVFPPLYREMIRDTRQVQPMAEMKTTPQPVPAAARVNEVAGQRVAQVR
jgi:hypothetical protein